MGSVIPLRNHHDSDEKEQLKNNNDFAESLFFDAEETDNSSDTDSKEEEQSLVNLKREIKLAKEALSILLNTPVDTEDTEIFIKWSEDVQKAKEHYRNLMKLFNEDIDADEEIKKQISKLETDALFLYTSYEKSNPFIEDAAEGEETTEITDNTSKSNLASSVETQLTTQPLQGNYVQPQPNTPIYININNGKLETQHITETKVDPTFLQNAVYDVKKAVGHGIRTVIKRGITILITVYASTFGTIFINQWFGFDLPSKIIKYMERIPLYDEILQLVNTIISNLKGL